MLPSGDLNEPVIVNTDVVDKYSPEIKEEYIEVVGRKRVKKTRVVKQYYIRSGDKALLVADHDNVMILKNSKGDRFSVQSRYVKKVVDLQ